MISASRKSSLVRANPSHSTSEATVDSREKRLRILEAALGLFLRYGVKRTSIDDVAREANIAKGTVYLYFGSKSALFAAIAEHLCSQTLAQAQQIAHEPRPAGERIAAVLDCYIGRAHRLVARSPHVSELTASKEAISAATYTALDRDMTLLLEGLLAEAGVAKAEAGEMFRAAAIGLAHSGYLDEAAYLKRLNAMVKVLVAGFRGDVRSKA